MTKQKGFTLIEMVVVMVILGILAAYAIPKFYDFSSSANTAAVNGLTGAINSANVTAHAAALAQGKTAVSGDTIIMEGATIALAYGYPTGEGITNAVNYSNPPFSVSPAATATSATFIVTGKTNCQVVYTAATSLTAPPTIVPTVSGC